MKRFIFIMSSILVFGFSIIGYTDAARPTYLNRHYFENGDYEIRKLEIEDEIVLTKSRSPYLIEDNIFVNGNGKLIIEPGVKIWFNNEKPELRVNFGGELSIRGKTSNEVFFRSYQGTEYEWTSLVFEDGSKVDIDYAIFNNGGLCNSATIIAESSELEINNSKFYSSDSPAVSIKGYIDPVLKNISFDLGTQDLVIQESVNADPYYENFSSVNGGHILITASTNLANGNEIKREINWEYPKVPYVIDGWISIGENNPYSGGSENAILNIHPGNNILFSDLDTEMKGSIHIQKGSSLNAENTNFNSYGESSESSWGSIYALEDSNLNLKNCKIINAGNYNREEIGKGALRIDTNSAKVSNTTIENSFSHGLYMGIRDIQPKFKNIQILESNGYAIYLEQNAKPIYEGIQQVDNNPNGTFVQSTSLRGLNNWKKDEGPYYLRGVYIVENDGSLILNRGLDVIFYSENGQTSSGIVVEDGGRFIASGLEDLPVSLKSADGDIHWGNIYLHPKSMGRFNYTEFLNGGNNDFIVSPPSSGSPGNNVNNDYAVILTKTNNLVVENSKFENIKNNAISILDNVNPFSIKENLFNLNKGDGVNNYGIYKWSGDLNTHALYNWWNDLTGPYNVINNPSGEGVLVSNEVSFDPFLSSPTDSEISNSNSIGTEIINNNLKSWQVRFNKTINKKFANTSYINILDSSGHFLNIHVELDPQDNKNIIVTPLEEYIPNRNYKIIIKSNIMSNDNLKLETKTIMNFIYVN